MLRRFVSILAVVVMLLMYPSVSFASSFSSTMYVSCYGDCGVYAPGTNPLYGNAVCSDSSYFFTGYDYAAALHPTFPRNALVEVTNVATGESVTVLNNDCHYGYTRPDLQEAAYDAIATPSDWSAGQMLVEMHVVGSDTSASDTATSDTSASAWTYDPVTNTYYLF